MHELVIAQYHVNIFGIWKGPRWKVYIDLDIDFWSIDCYIKAIDCITYKFIK